MIRSGGGQLSFDDLMDTEVGFKKRRKGGRRRRREPGSRCAPGMGRRGGNETDRQYAGAVPNLRLWRTGAAARERGGRLPQMRSLPTPERPLGQGTTLAGGGISEEEQVEDSQRPKTKAGTKQPCQEQVSGSPIACVLTQQCEQAKDHGGRPVTRDASDHQAEQDDRRHKRRSFVAAHRAYSLLAASGRIQPAFPR